MAERADDDTAARDADVETTVVPELAATQQAELAWSDAVAVEDLQLPGSWRPACRDALVVFMTCVAIAGAVMAIDRHWFSDLRDAHMVVAESSRSSPPPTPDVAGPSVAPAADYSPGPAAEHLVPPMPPEVAPPPAVVPQESLTASDMRFLSLMRSQGWNITDPQQMVLVAHQACFDLRRGASRQYVIANLLATDPAIGSAGAVSFYSNLMAAYDCA